MDNRRKHFRYPVTGDEILVLGRYSNNVAVVRNISMDGLQVEYINGRREGDQWTKIDISGDRQTHFMVPSVQCEVVYDISVLPENRTYTGMEARRCGLHFFELSEAQNTQLRQLLQHLTATTLV